MIFAVIFGIISAILSSLAMTYSIFVLGMYYLPGLIFGIFTLAFYLFIRKEEILFAKYLWLMLCTASYFIAFQIVSLSGAIGFYDTQVPFLPFLTAGSAGAFCMLMSFWLTIKKLPIVALLVLVILGGFLGLSYPLVMSPGFESLADIVESLPAGGFLVIFLPWQVVMLVGIHNFTRETSQSIPYKTG